MTPTPSQRAEQVYERVGEVIVEKNARYEIIQTTEAMKRIWIEAIADALSQVERETEDRLAARVRAWYAESPRRPASTAFTAGELRDFARMVEDVQRQTWEAAIQEAETWRDCGRSFVNEESDPDAARMVSARMMAIEIIDALRRRAAGGGDG